MVSRRPPAGVYLAGLTTLIVLADFRGQLAGWLGAIAVWLTGWISYNAGVDRRPTLIWRCGQCDDAISGFPIIEERRLCSDCDARQRRRRAVR